MARAVKTTATKAMKKARGLRVTRVRVTRVMMETSPREEGDDGHNNQLGTKAVAMATTVVATTARAITLAARATATGAKRATATTATMATMAAMVTMAMMMPNGKDDNENQVAMAARVIMTVARATVIGAKKGNGNDGNNGNNGGNNDDGGNGIDGVDYAKQQLCCQWQQRQQGHQTMMMTTKTTEDDGRCQSSRGPGRRHCADGHAAMTPSSSYSCLPQD
jgi:hypothetical protein